jgi:hypothetical protein
VRPYLDNPSHTQKKIGLVERLKVKALSSSHSTAKKKKSKCISISSIGIFVPFYRKITCLAQNP